MSFSATFAATGQQWIRLQPDSGRLKADPPNASGTARADKLYAKVLNEYGDDSVAQLGGAHLACEGVSNVLTKVLEWGRLMAYLEQSTRYVPYTDRPNGQWKYHVPAELDGSPLRDRFVRTLDTAFDTYARWIPALEAHFRAKYPKTPEDSDGVYRSVIRAKALDTLARAAAGGDDVERRAVRDGSGVRSAAAAHVRASAPRGPRACGADAGRTATGDPRVHGTRRSAESRRPLDRVSRGNAAALRCRRARSPRQICPRRASEEVTLTDFDPDGELKVVAAALYSHSTLPDAQLLALARRLSADDRAALLKAYVGQRGNRRHKPGRAFERTSYRFDVLTDYGAFRDLQRHRMLTLEWQPLSPRHGYTEPAAIEEAGAQRRLAHGDEPVGGALRSARRRRPAGRRARTPSSWPTASASTWT